MRNFTAALSLALLAVLALPAQAAEKVALLDWQRALMQTDAAQSSMEKLEGQVGEQQKRAQALAEELQKLQRQLEEEGELMSEEDRRATMEEYQRKGAEFEGLRQQVLQAQQQAESSFLQQAEPKLEQAVDEVVERRNIDVLVDPRGVLKAPDDLPDVTEEVTQILNELL